MLYFNVFNKVIYNYLDMDYKNGLMDYHDQTNKTICKIMNDFINRFKDDFKTKKTFILISNNDIYTLVAYNIIKNIQGQYGFKFKVLGPVWNLKKEIPRKDRLKIMRKSKNFIYLSCYNPIYNVKNEINYYVNLSRRKDYYRIVDKFTPEQFKIICNFYSINNPQLLQEFEREEIKGFSKFINREGFIDYFYNMNDIKFFKEIYDNNENLFNIVLLKGTEEDFEIFDKIINDVKPCFYFIKNKTKEKIEFIKQNLNYYVRPCNCISEINTNQMYKVEEFINDKFGYRIYGNETISSFQELKKYEDFYS